jgi:hypothetical protein
MVIRIAANASKVSGKPMRSKPANNPAISSLETSRKLSANGFNLFLTQGTNSPGDEAFTNTGEATMTIVIYERISSRGQKLDSQHHDLEAWAKGQQANGQVIKWYADKFTGKSMDRPSMTKLLADIRGGKIKAIVCWRLDRLGRTAKGLTALFDELVALKVNFVSLKDGIDLSRPQVVSSPTCWRRWRHTKPKSVLSASPQARRRRQRRSKPSSRLVERRLW